MPPAGVPGTPPHELAGVVGPPSTATEAPRKTQRSIGTGSLATRRSPTDFISSAIQSTARRLAGEPPGRQPSAVSPNPDTVSVTRRR